MTKAIDLEDSDLDTAAAAAADPEWRYVNVRRFAAGTGTGTNTGDAGAFLVPEVDDEVVLGVRPGDTGPARTREDG